MFEVVDMLRMGVERRKEEKGVNGESEVRSTEGVVDK
jgi:hypothetical protein